MKVKKVSGTPGKRPVTATPERALELHEKQGLTLVQIGLIWGITKQRVWQLIQKAKRNQQ